MRRYHIATRPGSLKNLVLREGDVPTVSKGAVLVRVKAVGLNYADIFAIMGLYSATPKEPFVPGLEFSGVVEQSDAAAFRVGDAVIGVTRFGGYDSHIVADPAYLLQLPEGWSFKEGAAFPVQTLTAYYALFPLGNLKEGQTVLIHSAAGDVGMQANRMAKRVGAFTIGVVGNPSKLVVLEQEGYNYGLVRDNQFRTNLRTALAGRELNLVLEASGGKYFRYSYEALAPMGRLVAYGSAQFTPSSHRPNYLSLAWKYIFRPRVDPLTMITENKSVLAFNLIWLYEKKWLMKELIDEVNSMGLPPPKVGHVFDFSDARNALHLFKKGHTTGKVVLTIGD
jgi:NADPH:quinone reductase-like Zn-dependent oxidoreductase